MPAKTEPPADARLLMRHCLQKVATGPEYSKDLDRNEARAAARHLLSGECDEVQAAVLLIALRMKRETDDENIGFLQAIHDTVTPVQVGVDRLADIADPYDGYTRCLPMAPFLPAVLAACDQPAFNHGVETLGPKYGATHRKILRACGVHVDLSPADAAKQIEDIGWAYLDQRHFCPALHDLIALRTRIVKRPILTTVEVLARPLKGRDSTHLITGYVHKAYPPVYVRLAHAAAFDSCAIIRGVEGGVAPSLRQPANVHHAFRSDDYNTSEVSAAALGITASTRAVPVPDDLPPAKTRGDDIATEVDIDALVDATAGVGMAALNAEPGAAFDSLLYAAAVALAHLRGAASPAEVADDVRDALVSGRALERFNAAT